MSHEDTLNGKPSVNVPPELWLLISRVIEPNPLIYVNLARVCRSSRQVFTCDKLWRYLVPIDGPVKGFYNIFDKRMREKSRQEAAQILSNWQGLFEDHGYPLSDEQDSIFPAPKRIKRAVDLATNCSSSPDLELSFCKYIFSKQTVQLDIQFWRCALKQNALLFEFAPAAYKELPGFVLFAIEQAGCSPMFLPSGSPVFEVLEVAKAAVERTPKAVSKIPVAFLKDHMDLLYRAVNLHPWVIIQDSLQYFRDDFDVAKLAVTQSGQLLGLLSDRLQSNHELVRIAVSNYGAALQIAPSDLRADRQLVLSAVSKYGLALRFASAELRNDKDVVLAAVRDNGDARSYASPTLQLDRDVIAAALMTLRD